MDINEYYDTILKDAQNWLQNVEDEHFLNEFLAIHESSIGPTVEEFIHHVANFDTYKLFNIDRESLSDFHINYNDISCLNTKNNFKVIKNLNKDFSNILYGEELSQITVVKSKKLSVENLGFTNRTNTNKSYVFSTSLDEYDMGELLVA